jgi:CubicO group peptidase (beta-lactamase class C family)
MLRNGRIAAMDRIASMIKSDFPHIRAACIMQHGKALLREFFNGRQSIELNPVGCVFKSFVSALVGIALYEKRIQSPEQRVIVFYPQVNAADIDPYFSLLTLEHTLTKTSGLIWPGPGEKLPGSMREVWKLKFRDRPGEKFEYKPDPQITVYLLEDLYGEDIVKIAEGKLFEPLGITQWAWDRSNIEGMRISLDGLERFAELYLSKGVYHGKRFFSEAFYQSSIRPYSMGGFPEEKPYGYSWWLDAYQGAAFFCACGFGGQHVCILPSLDAVIVLLSEMDRPHGENRAVIRNAVTLLRNDAS